MKELLMENLKNYGEMLNLKQLEKKELLKEISNFKKLEKMAFELEKCGGVIELPNIDEKKLRVKEIELDIKMCKSIIRRYENVIQMYSVDGTVEDTEITE